MKTDHELWLTDRIASIMVMGFTTLDDKDIPMLQSIADDVRRLNGKCSNGCAKVIEEMQRLLEDDGK